MVIPEELLPGGVVGPASSVLEQDVKNAAPKVLNTKVEPAFSKNFLLDSVKDPVLMTSDFSMID